MMKVVSLSPSRRNLQLEGIRERSRGLVYHCLLGQHATGLSRNDISRSTELSHPTISTILQEFTTLGLVREVGRSAARGGRPARLVRFNALASCVISIDLSGERPCAALLDLTGAILDRLQGPLLGVEPAAGLLDWLDTVVAAYRRKYPIGLIAVALPGVVEPATGTVHFAPALDWHDYPLASVLRKRLGHDVILENDVNALALGELHYGDNLPCENAVFLSITSGIGMGLVINGGIYRGSSSAAGEIGYGKLGHVASQSNPSFGQPGPLETHLLGLVRSFSVRGEVRLESPGAQAAFERFAADLSVVLQNTICLLNPDRLVVSWPGDTQALLVRRLRTSLSTPMPIEVLSAAPGPDGTLRGAARLALDLLESRFCNLEPVEQVAA